MNRKFCPQWKCLNLTKFVEQKSTSKIAQKYSVKTQVFHEGYVDIDFTGDMPNIIWMKKCRVMLIFFIGTPLFFAKNPPIY
jgi:hypothetical protein